MINNQPTDRVQFTLPLDMRMWSRFEDISARRPFEISINDSNNYLANFRVHDPDVSESLGGGAYTGGLLQYYRFNQEFEPISGKVLEYEWSPSTVVSTSSVPMIFTFPFTNHTLTTFSESGYIYEASSDEFLIRIYTPDGSYSHSMYAPVEAAPFTDNDREQLIEEKVSYARGFSAISLPDQWPVLNQIKVDDKNQLWVSRITTNQDSTEWWVLDENSNLLAKFNWPRKLAERPGAESQQYIIKNGAIYYLRSESMELDQQTVTRYRFDMTPSN